jgi:hypothetical protein
MRLYGADSGFRNGRNLCVSLTRLGLPAAASAESARGAKRKAGIFPRQIRGLKSLLETDHGASLKPIANAIRASARFEVFAARSSQSPPNRAPSILGRGGVYRLQAIESARRRLEPRDRGIGEIERSFRARLQVGPARRYDDVLDLRGHDGVPGLRPGGCRKDRGPVGAKIERARRRQRRGDPGLANGDRGPFRGWGSLRRRRRRE